MFDPADVDTVDALDFFMATRPEWMARGACLEPGVDSAMFYSYSPALIDAARTVCARCPVMELCLDHALEHAEQGVWGATSEEQRRRLRRTMRRAS